jgi:hypothetical protein
MEESAEPRQNDAGLDRTADLLLVPAQIGPITNILVPTSILVESQREDSLTEEQFPVDRTSMNVQPPELDLPCASILGNLAEEVVALGVPGDQQPISLTGEGENAYVKFQLIPISETPGKSAVGDVAERKLVVGDVMKLGRMFMRDGQATINGTKAATEIDVWFQSKVVSRLHAEIWTKDGQVFNIN